MEDKTVFEEIGELIALTTKNDLWSLGDDLALQIKNKALRSADLIGALETDIDNLCLLVDSLKGENDSLKSQINSIQAIADNDLDEEGLSLHQRFSFQTQMQTLEQASREQLLDFCRMMLLNLYQRDNCYKNIIAAQWGFLEEPTNA